MTPRTIDELARAGAALGDHTVEAVIQPEWTVGDEPQLSYTSMVCLAECLREFHWQRDLDALIGTAELDATARSMSAEFFRPVLVGSRVVLSYAIADVEPSSYRFACRITSDGQLCSTVEVKLVFIRPDHPGRAAAPVDLRRRLAQLASAPDLAERR